MVELELTYLPKYLPENLADLPHKEVHDIYFPLEASHPVIRLRKNGAKYELTKKEPIEGTDSSAQNEFTIPLTEKEFLDFKQHPGKHVRKIRYQWASEWGDCEIDVFQDEFVGLVLVDFEFATPQQKTAFQMPDFCLADVTQDLEIAGGWLAGRKYSDITNYLADKNYQPLFL